MKLNRKRIFFILLNIGFFFIISNFIFNIIAMKNEIRVMKSEDKIVSNKITQMQLEKKRMEKDYLSLSSDKTIEKIAREKLNMARKGEMIFRIVEDKK